MPTWGDLEGAKQLRKNLAIDDLVSFEGLSVNELKSAFKEAVDDYPELLLN